MTTELQEIAIVDDNIVAEDEHAEMTAVGSKRDKTADFEHALYNLLMHDAKNGGRLSKLILKAQGRPFYKDVDFYKLIIVTALVFLFFLAELVAGIVTGSLAMLSDAFHMLSDLIGLIIGISALVMSRKKSNKWLTYGFGRAEVLGGLSNNIFLLSMVLFIILSAVERYMEPKQITSPLAVLIVGCLGISVNIIGILLFCGHNHHGHDHGHEHGHKHDHAKKQQQQQNPQIIEHSASNHDHSYKHDLEHGHSHEHEHGHAKKSKKPKHKNENIVGVFLHMVGDFLGSIAVIITATLLMIFEGKPNSTWVLYMDPTLSVVFSLIILFGAAPGVARCLRLLMQTAPKHVDTVKLQDELEKLDGILAVHELHVWSLVSSKVVATVHVVCNGDHLRFMEMLAPKIKQAFHKHGIHSSVIQPEFADVDSESSAKQDLVFRQRLGLCNIVCGAGVCLPEQCCPVNIPPELNEHIKQQQQQPEDDKQQPLDAHDQIETSITAQEPSAGENNTSE